MIRHIKALDKVLNQEIPLLLILLLLLVLRLPNLFEPYWYGDEGIYLTLGIAMRNGARLYAEIIDHKTPLIYYFSMVPNQFWFRILTIVWMTITTAVFYHIALKLLKKLWPTIVATTAFVIMTSVPWFEGNIPNGELFVMGFALSGGLLLLYTKFFAVFADQKTLIKTSDPFPHYFQEKVSRFLKNTHDQILYIGAGLLFGLAILTKVPAVLDVAAFLTIGWFGITNSFTLHPKDRKGMQYRISITLVRMLSIGIGILVPILLSIFYFWLRGSADAYLDYGLLYNFRYVQNWQLPFSSPFLRQLFTLEAKFAIATALVLLLTFSRRFISPALQFAGTWFALALFATLLSNRPYPHYFLQVMPAAALLIGLSFDSILSWILLNKNQKTVARFHEHMVSPAISIALISLFIWVIFVMNVGLYPTLKYYRYTTAYVTGKISQQDYFTSFNHLMTDNYAAAEIITQTDNPYLFVWGTNPTLYALTQKQPVGRFTVSFHIKDFDAYAETLTDLKKNQPDFVVVMDDEGTTLDGLNTYLDENYVMHEDFSYYDLWKRQP